MKKYIILIFITMLTMWASFFISNSYVKSIPQVNVVKITPTLIKNIVSCSGRVEEKNKTDVVCENLFVPSKIHVREGERIKKGQLLVTVDKEATIAAYSAQSSKAAQVFGPNNSDFDLEKHIGRQNKDGLTEIPSHIYSTADGIVTSINAKEGSVLYPAQPLLTVSDLSRLQVRVNVNESDISKIKKGQRAIISGIGFAGKKLNGKVESIGLVAKTPLASSNTEAVVEVIIGFENTSNAVKPGFTAKTEIITSEIPDKIIVPFTSVVQDEDGVEYVYLYQSGKAIRKDVKLGKEIDEGYEVIEGINGGDCVVINPDKIKKDKSQVILKKGRVM